MANPTIVLKAGRDRSVRRRHPWIFSGAIDSAPEGIEPGTVVDVALPDGEFVGRGTYNPNSQIQVRIYTFEDRPLDDELITGRVHAALDARRGLVDGDTDTYRLINAEGDDLPGLVADRMGEYVVCQVHSIGAHRFIDAVAGALVQRLGVQGILLRSDTKFAGSEGLPEQPRILYGRVPQGPVTIRENGLLMSVDLWGGHKTGHYCDQRPNRRMVRGLAGGRRVLDVFSYTGGFGLSALSGGALHVTFVESSEAACGLIRENLRSSDFEESRAEIRVVDAFDFLSADRDKYDLIVLDPPAFARSKAQVNEAARGYKEINLRAMRALAPGGILATFSCSGHVDIDLFQKIVFGAAVDAKANLRIIARLFAGPDHPTSLFCPEGDYLKGLACQLA